MLMARKRAQTAMPFSLRSQNSRRGASENKTAVVTEVGLELFCQLHIHILGAQAPFVVDTYIIGEGNGNPL